MAWAIFREAHSKAILEIISSGSDRVAAIVGGAFLDETVSRTLTERFRDDAEAIKQTMGVDRPLGNVGPKIDVLYLLYGIDGKMRFALKGISGVRNFFAHNLEATFNSTDQQFLSSMGALTLHTDKTHYPNPFTETDSEYPIDPINNKRDQFVVNLQLGLIALMRDGIFHLPYTNEPRNRIITPAGSP
jgi:DNA-binding MltR family transcriptional regulator